MSEDEWKSLPTLSKVQHQNWKARVEGYNEASRLFTTQDSPNAPVFNEYVGLMSKFALDPMATAQESAFEAVLAFLDCANVATNLFGPKVLQLKPLVKDFPRLCEDRDKNVRNETKNLIVEFYRWVGQGQKAMLAELKPVIVTEINDLLSKLPSEKPTPVRYLKSQKPKDDEIVGSNQGVKRGGEGDNSANAAEDVEIDLEELQTPIEVLSKIPADYWTMIVVNKDINVMLATLAVKILGQLAKGLRKKYAPYAQQTVATILMKFKERKPTLVAAARETIDFSSKSITLDVMADDVISSLAHKTPGVRAETALFLSRVFDRSSPAVLTKKLIKPFTAALCESSKDTAGDVRENSFIALGTLMRVVGSKNIDPFLADLDAIRLGKIKEHCSVTVGETSETKAAVPGSARPSKPRAAPPVKRPGTAPTKENDSESPTATTDAPKKAVKGRKPVGTSKSGSASVAAVSKPTVATETLLSDDQVLQEASELWGEELMTNLGATEWKTRLAAVGELQTRSQAMDTSKLPTQLICRALLRKPGLKDTNVQTLKSRVELLQTVITAAPSCTSTLAELLVPELVEKIGDLKVGEMVKATLTVLAERTTFSLVGSQVLLVTFTAKNPKTQTETLNWLTQAVREFGMGLPPRDVVTTMQTGLNATNPAVRQATLSLASVVHLFMGDVLRKLLENEKPAIVTLLNIEFDKNAGQKPPVLTRGRLAGTGSGGGSGSSGKADGEGDDDGDGTETIADEELDSEAGLPRTDIRVQSRQTVVNALLRTSPDTVSAITLVTTGIASSDVLVSCHALSEIDLVLRTPDKWSLLLNHVSQILMLITMQLRQVTSIYFGDPSISDEQLRTLVQSHLATVDSLFHCPALAREASREVLRDLIQSLLNLMLDERTTEMLDGENVIRAINSLCVRIISSANGTRVLSALIRLLHESVSSGQFTNRLTQSVMKSLWRITKEMDAEVNNYSFDVILLDCHHFLKAFPPSSWKNRKSDVPIRTIKTLLHVICRLQGPAILDLLELIPNKDESDLENYLVRTLKTMANTPSTMTRPRRPSGAETTGKIFAMPSAATREKIAEIFKKVASPNSKDGLNELYDFTQLYPEIDLSVFLSKSSQFFQTYIKQAMRNIAIERTRPSRSQAGAGGDINLLRSSLPAPLNGMAGQNGQHLNDPDFAAQSSDPKVFMHRLAQLRRQLGLGGESTTNVDEPTRIDPDDTVLPPGMMDKTLRNLVHPTKTGPSDVDSEQVNSGDPKPRPPISADELLDIQRRLAQIKRGQPAV